jgi:hypothetical protein
MPQEWRHESQDLADFEVLDAADTLTGPPGDDPLDRGVITPERWSAAMQFGSTAAEQEAGESLDQLLAEEEPDIRLEMDVDPQQADGWDENATEAEIRKLAHDASPDPRTGRLAPEDDGGFPIANADYVARDAGIDGGGATAEEAAVHLVLEDEL